MSAFLGAQPPPEYFLGAEPPLELFSGSATVPGDNEVLWYKQDIDHMPSSVVINVPGDVQGDFYLKFTVEDKSVGIVLYQSGAPLYLTMQTMKNRYKCVVLERK
jgi:hypothetical protein